MWQIDRDTLRQKCIDCAGQGLAIFEGICYNTCDEAARQLGPEYRLYRGTDGVCTAQCPRYVAADGAQCADQCQAGEAAVPLSAEAVQCQAAIQCPGGQPAALGGAQVCVPCAALGLVEYGGKCYEDCSKVPGTSGLLLKDGVCAAPGLSRTALVIIVALVVILVISIITVVLYLFLGYKMSCARRKDLRAQALPPVQKYSHDAAPAPALREQRSVLGLFDDGNGDKVGVDE